jgi:hypothetical protein
MPHVDACRDWQTSACVLLTNRRWRRLGVKQTMLVPQPDECLRPFPGHLGDGGGDNAARYRTVSGRVMRSPIVQAKFDSNDNAGLWIHPSMNVFTNNNVRNGPEGPAIHVPASAGSGLKTF